MTAQRAAWLPVSAVVLLLGGCLHFHSGALPGEPAATATDRYVKLRDARVHYVDEGSGPAVVLLHGFASSEDVWDGVAHVLARNFRVIRPDLKGFGWTDRPEGDYSPQEQARLVFALLDELGIERAAFVGHSWGSSVALAAALDSPDRVSRIALYAAWVFEAQLPTFFVWSRASGVGEALFATFYNNRADERVVTGFYNPELVSESLIEEIERELDQPGTVAAALAATRGQRFAAMEERYSTVTQPTLLLWGREDRVSRLAVGEVLLNTLPNASLEVFPRCGHFPMLEAFAPSTAALTEFLSAAGSPAATSGSRASDSRGPEARIETEEGEL